MGGTETPFVATRGKQRRDDNSLADEQRRRAAIALIERYDRRLRRTARRYSLCADDAEDAYQRAMEILLTKAPVLDPDRLVRWMHTVTRHEAYAVRRQRERLLDGAPAVDEDGTRPVDLLPSEAPEPDVGAERSERVTRSFEALGSLKPQEIRTLTLKAEGYSYDEIGEITGFSRTKINRCMVEGRRRFLKTFAAIEEGERCDQLSDALSAFSDGELRDGERPALVEHLNGCSRCRAKLRAYRQVPRRVLSLAPIAVLGGPSLVSRAGDRIAGVGDRTREVAASVLHRGSGSLEASQTVAAGGGSRGSGLAILGVVCGLGAAGGGAAVCADQGVIPNPIGGASPRIERHEQAMEPLAPDRVDAPAPEATVSVEQPPTAPAATPVQQRQREFTFESGNAPSQSSGTTEFGGPPASSASSGGAGSAGGGGFGFEK